MRAFIAIEIDSMVKKKIISMIHHFKKVSSRVKWVKPEALHLTLKFLGNIDEIEADKLKNIMDKISNEHPCFDLSCSGIGTFPLKSRNPKVIWVGIENNSFVKGVYEDIEKEAERIGFSREKRNFHPHLTLGRVKKKPEIQKLLPELERTKDNHFGITKVDKLTLFKSTLTPQGSVYEILHESQFK